MPITPLEVVGFAPETVPGTFVVPSKFVPGKGDINQTTKVARPTQSRGTRSQVIDVVTGLEVEVVIIAELIPEVLSTLVAGWFGIGSDAVSGSAGVGYTHTLTPKNTIPSYSVEIDYDIATQLLAEQATGCKVDQIAFKATQQTFATIEARMIGAKLLTPATPGLPSNPTPTITTLQPMDFSLLLATYRGAANTQLMDATLTLMNHVQRVFSSNQSLGAARLVETHREVQLTTNFDFLDLTFFNDWWGAGLGGIKPASGLVLTLTTSGNITGATNPYVVEFTVPGIRPQGAYALKDANDVVNQDLT